MIPFIDTGRKQWQTIAIVRGLVVANKYVVTRTTKPQNGQNQSK